VASEEQSRLFEGSCRYLITVCSKADRNCPTTFPGLGKRLHRDSEDPAEFEGTEVEKLDKFRAVRDEIGKRVQEWVARH
jgi:arsenate reductase